MPLGIYISVPFCRTKCSYCNFASDVFSKAAFEGYVSRVCRDIAESADLPHLLNVKLEPGVDSIYLGGGTPSLLSAPQLTRVFAALRNQFDVLDEAEITVECAPGTLSDELIATLSQLGVGRVSLGAQSFVDEEAASVGRRHTRAMVLDDVARLRSSGISNINVDLIAGLPYQSAESWRFSLEETIAIQVPHVSVYMLEVDKDSRLGRELLAGGQRYHAHLVPKEEAIADFYVEACERLHSAGIAQYEISNFARSGFESRHNLKYWQRKPYLGFGVDAHSMLPSTNPHFDAVRFAAPDSLDDYLTGKKLQPSTISQAAALEENLFLGLRLNCGVSLSNLLSGFGSELLDVVFPKIAECVGDGLIHQTASRIRLTSRGRLLSNEVFERLLIAEQIVS